MNVLGKIERHLRKTGKKPTRFGREAANDPRLVFDLRQGRAVGAVLTARIEAFLEAAQ
jgi:hypothetical protein